MRAWLDRWIPTLENFKPLPLAHTVDISSSLKVSDLIIQNNRVWNLPLLTSLFQQESINEILKIPLPNSKLCSDSLFWTIIQNGKFSVKSAHHLVLSIASTTKEIILNIPWRKIWNLKIHDRHKLLLSKILWDILPTRERLRRFIPSLPSINCPLCNESEEALLHLFIECPISRILWNHSKWPLNLSSLGVNSMSEWFQYIIHPKQKLDLASQEEHPFKIFPGLILDFIWRLRNDQIHNPKDLSLQNQNS